MFNGERDTLKHVLHIVRDMSRSNGERAFAATQLAAGFCDEPQPAAYHTDDPAQRMFGYGVRHDTSIAWDGRGARSGTITYVGTERVEQYVGKNSWITYQPSIFGEILPQVGDQLRIVRRNGSIEFEQIAPNRLHLSAQRVVEASSGLLLLREKTLAAGELEETVAAVAKRYSSAASNTPSEIARIDFGGGARLFAARVTSQAFAQTISSDLFSPSLGAAVRVEVHARSDRLDAALDAERALILCAALLAADEPAAALDDTSAHFTPAQLYDLAAQNGIRADSFRFAAAAAQRDLPPSRTWFQDGFLDELAIFTSHPLNAEHAFKIAMQDLVEFSEVAELCSDPVVPRLIAYADPDDKVECGELQPFAQLAYDTVEIAMAFIKASATTGFLAELLASRQDVEALLGQPPEAVLVLSVRRRPSVSELALDLRRADAFVTALAAGFARNNEAIASDGFGTLYAIADLVELARHRRGRNINNNTATPSM